MKIITLTTDFKTTDWYVGTMKGVILGIAPRALVVDITHELPPGDVRAGAFALAAGYRFFPRASIHVAVVDPGVGSGRGAIVAQTADYFFVGPDNGVLSWALRNERVKSIRRLEDEKYFLRPISQTFHGRDVFAPVAAYLSNGVTVEKFGPEDNQIVRLPWPEPRRTRHEAQGEIIYLDRFGNAITNLSEELLAGFEQRRCRILLRGKTVAALKRFYQEVPAGHVAALVSSSGFLELAVNGGSAAKKLKAKVGDTVTVRSETHHKKSSSF